MSVKPKYRNLTREELQELEKEFVDYLIINGIIASDWERLKQEETEKAEDIITLFSDVIFEGIMRKVEFLEKRMTHEFMTFQCLKDRLVLVAISSASTDFTNPESIQQAVKSPPKDAEIYTTDKKYSLERELELFQMIESGCTISDGKRFKTLSMAL